tara:strand:- start:793 stop:1476 length:684 start_codon:yes stop_codon:yes gene_type:complete
MALKLLNPGLRPLGQFDVEDDDTLVGGEYVELATLTATGSSAETATEGYAADVGMSYGSGIIQNSAAVQFARAARTVGNLGGLADEGTTGYGTMFGTAISMFGTGLGALSTRGVVTLGPKSHLASGKVTVWCQEGLYGITSEAFSGTSAPSAATAVNTRLFADDTDANDSDLGRLTTVADSNGQVGINVGMQRDSSLVSTTKTAAGETIEDEHLVIFYTGNAEASTS